MNALEYLRASIGPKEGASSEALERAQQRLGVTLPADYLLFMKECDGGEGSLRDGENMGHANLWPISEVVESNESFQADDLYPGYIVIGSTGGGEAFAIRGGSVPPEYVLMHFIGGVDDALFGGHSLGEFLQCYANDEIWER